ncbi:MAG: MXAN_2562 family outer membrane beta-barrel protein, partial [Myxococcota bacterium]|nr:MXAN_2562 family outer membrane beta-barrel protein [Myxococcota bacterium]
GLSETTSVHLIVLDPQLLETTPTPYSVTFAVIFPCERPSAPNNVTAVGGEESLRVGWDAVTNAEKYKVYYATSSFTEGTRPESLSSGRSIQANSVTSLTVSSGISANSTYYVGVSTIDDDGNESLLSNVVIAETGVVDDFWERYSRENPDIESGFCFLATAAWGSYQEEHVQVLRDFRDRFLLSNMPGRLFVDAYYAASPPLAHFIAKHDTLRAITRTLLYPLYAFAIVMLYSNGWVLAGLGLLLCTLFVLRRRLRRAGRPSRRLPRLALGAAATILLFVPFAAYAESPIDMVFEVKAGPYAPDQLGSTYDQYFGDDSALVFEFELDYQLYRGIGSAAIGASFGYGGVTGKALTPEGETSIDETSLDWLPLRLQAVYRFDLLAQRLDVPIAFQVKLGLDYYLWWIEDGGGDTAVNEQGEDGSGGTFGWHTAFGISLLLDWLSPTLAKGFDVEWGVNNSYLFAEFLYASINGFGSSSSLDLSTDGTYQIGLALEF